MCSTNPFRRNVQIFGDLLVSVAQGFQRTEDSLRTPLVDLIDAVLKPRYRGRRQVGLLGNLTQRHRRLFQGTPHSVSQSFIAHDSNILLLCQC